MSGCGRQNPTSSRIDKPKTSIDSVNQGTLRPDVNDPLPEDSTQEAINHHGLPYIIGLAESNNTKAEVFLANAYENGTPGLVRDEEAAYRWMLRAANQSDAHAQFQMANYWFNSVREGTNPMQVNQKLMRTLAWLFIAEAGGHPKARDKLNELEQLFIGNKSRIAGFRDEVWKPAQKIANQWRPCTDAACWTQELTTPPPASCALDPTSIACSLDK